MRRTLRCDGKLLRPYAGAGPLRSHGSVTGPLSGWSAVWWDNEDAHRYANRIGAPVFSFLRTVVMNLLRRGGYRSIRRGLRALAHDIKGMLALGGIQLAENST